MLAVVWRVSGEPFDVDAFVSEFGLQPDSVWRKGDACRVGAAPCAESGFNLSLDRDDDDLARALEDIRVFLRERRSALESLRELGLQSTVDIGVTVGSKGRYTCSLRIPPSDLAEIARSGIVLEVSVYPCSDEQEPSPPLQPTGSACG